MSDPDEITKLKLRPRRSEAVSLSVPVDTLDMLRRVASTRDMELEALLKL